MKKTLEHHEERLKGTPPETILGGLISRKIPSTKKNHYLGGTTSHSTETPPNNAPIADDNTDRQDPPSQRYNSKEGASSTNRNAYRTSYYHSLLPTLTNYNTSRPFTGSRYLASSLNLSNAKLSIHKVWRHNPQRGQRTLLRYRAKTRKG